MMTALPTSSPAAAGRVAQSARTTAAAAMLILAAQPCIASTGFNDTGSAVRRSATFAGANIRMSLGGRTAAKPSARLQLGMTHSYEDRTSASSGRMVRITGLELGASGTGSPAFYMGGQEVRQLKKRAGLQGSTGTALLVIGAVAAAALLVVAVSSGGDEECAADDWFC